MAIKLPRIASVKAEPPALLHVAWQSGDASRIEFSDWLDGDGHAVHPLRSPAVFATARLGEHGASVEWDGGDNLAIDAVHLAMLAGRKL